MKILKHLKDTDDNKLHHTVLVESSEEPDPEKVAFQLMYSKSGYGMWDVRIYKKDNDNWSIEWKSWASCN